MEPIPQPVLETPKLRGNEKLRHLSTLHTHFLSILHSTILLLKIICVPLFLVVLKDISNRVNNIGNQAEGRHATNANTKNSDITNYAVEVRWKVRISFWTYCLCGNSKVDKRYLVDWKYWIRLSTKIPSLKSEYLWVISIKVEAMKADKLTKKITTLKKEEKENARWLPIMNCEEEHRK